VVLAGLLSLAELRVDSQRVEDSPRGIQRAVGAGMNHARELLRLHSGGNGKLSLRHSALTEVPGNDIG